MRRILKRTIGGRIPNLTRIASNRILDLRTGSVGIEHRPGSRSSAQQSTTTRRDRASITLSDGAGLSAADHSPQTTLVCGIHGCASADDLEGSKGQ